MFEGIHGFNAAIFKAALIAAFIFLNFIARFVSAVSMDERRLASVVKVQN